MSRKHRAENPGQPSFLTGYTTYKTEPSQWDDSVVFFLPVEFKRLLLEERQRRAIEDRRIRNEHARLEAIARAPATAPQPPSTNSPIQENNFTKVFERGVAHRSKRKHHPVVSAREVLRVADLVSRTRDKEYARRDSMLLDRIRSKGALRAVANPIFRPALWTHSVETLRMRHPHFADVTNLIDCYVQSSARSKEPLMIPALLLWGEPGIGKTQYAQDLAQALGAPLRRQSMENAQTTSLLLGTERHWSSAGPGVLLEEIILGNFANPIFLLDELDKTPAGGRYDPLAALHCLLEPLTAKRVRDAGLDLEFDASLATYIATANDPNRIPASLLSRFRQFEIRAPRGEAALIVARSLVKATIELCGIPAFTAPSHSLSHRLAHLTAREISQAVRDAVAKAVAAGRMYLVQEDFSQEITGLEARHPIH